MFSLVVAVFLWTGITMFVFKRLFNKFKQDVIKEFRLSENK